MRIKKLSQRPSEKKALPHSSANSRVLAKVGRSANVQGFLHTFTIRCHQIGEGIFIKITKKICAVPHKQLWKIIKPKERIGESKVSRRQMSDVERSQIMTHKLLCLISRLSVLLHNNKRCSLFQNRTWFPLKCWTTNSSPVSSLSDKDNIPNSLKVEIKLYFLKKLNIFLNGNLIAIWTQHWWISSYV